MAVDNGADECIWMEISILYIFCICWAQSIVQSRRVLDSWPGALERSGAIAYKRSSNVGKRAREFEQSDRRKHNEKKLAENLKKSFELKLKKIQFIDSMKRKSIDLAI